MDYDPQNAQVYRDHLNMLSRQVNALGNLNRAFQQSTDVVRQSTNYTNLADRAMRGYTSTLDRGTRSVSDGFKMLGRDADSARNAFSYFAKTALGVFSGRVIGDMVEYVGDLTSTYKRMSDVGQTFNGDLFKMASAAAQSGLTMNEFAKFMEKNSAIASQMTGGGGLGKLAKEVRVSAERFGQFGYTMDGLNDLTSSYLENMRLTGQLDSLNNKKATDGIILLAKQTTELSVAFGKNRAEITKTTMDAMKNASLQAKILQMNGDAGEKYGLTITSAINALAGQQGPAGSFLSQWMAGIAGANGQGTLTAQSQVFNQAALPQMNILMEQYYKKMAGARPEDQVDIANDLVKDMREQIKNQLPQLQAMASWGNKEAEQVIELYTNLKEKTKEELEKAKKDAVAQNSFTKSMSNFQTVWGSVTGSIRDKFYPALERFSTAFAEGWAKFVESDSAKRLLEQFNKLGNSFEAWVTRAFSAENMEAFASGLSKIISFFSDVLTPAIAGVGKAFDSLGIGLKEFGIVLAGLLGLKVAGMVIGGAKGAIGGGKAIAGMFKGSAGAAAAGEGAGMAGAAAGAKGMGGLAGKALGLGGIGLGAFLAYSDVKEIMAEREAGRLNDDEYRKKMVAAISGHMGGMAGGIGGGLIGGLAGGVGSIFGAVGGSALGSKYGSYLGTEWAAGKIFDNFLAGNAQGSTSQPSGRTSSNEEIVALTQRLSDAERRVAELSDAAQTGPNSRMDQLIAQMEELKKAIKEQTEVLAAQNNYMASLLDRQVRNQRSNFGD